MGQGRVDRGVAGGDLRRGGIGDGKVTLDNEGVVAPPVSYAPMFNFGDTETAGNAQRFATYQEAYDSAQDRFRVWTMPTGFYVAETNDPVNYRRENGADVSNTTNIIGD